MSVIVATAYMEEAERFETLIAMDAGRILATGAPTELKVMTGATTVEDACIALLPEERRSNNSGSLTISINTHSICRSASGSGFRWRSRWCTNRKC